MIEEEITEKKTAKTKRSKPTNTVYNPRSEQLCWNCKRCTNAPGYECPWAADGTPIEGWTVTGKKEYFYTSGNSDKKYSLGMSYDIVDCPLFIKDREFASYKEEMDEIARVLNIGYGYLRTESSKQKLLNRYEKITGRKVPYYVRHHTEERDGERGSNGHENF